MRFRPAHQSMINRRHDDRASSRARHSLNSRLKKSHEFTRLLLEKADMRVDKIWRTVLKGGGRDVSAKGPAAGNCCSY